MRIRTETRKGGDTNTDKKIENKAMIVIINLYVNFMKEFYRSYNDNMRQRE